MGGPLGLTSKPPLYCAVSYVTSVHLAFIITHNIIRGNPVVREKGDTFRDTVVLTVRGDGVDIPPLFILHTSHSAAKTSERHCPKDETPIKGMNIQFMKEYVDHVASYVKEPSLLIMDRLSSHTSSEVIQYILSKRTESGGNLLIPILMQPKTAFLISPLDMGAIGAFKSYYHQLDRGTIEAKKRAVTQAWKAVSNEALRNICLNCGIVGEEDLETLRSRFMKEVVGLVPERLEEVKEFYDAWASGFIQVEGAKRGRGVTFEIPQQLEGTGLDGVKWTQYGGYR